MSDNPSITIRSAQLQDAGRLLEIYGHYVSRTAVTFEYDIPTAEEFLARMKRTMGSYPFLVILRDGRIEGYSYAGPFYGRAAYGWCCETSVYLDPRARGQGLGRLLYGALESRLKEMGIVSMYACIAVPEVPDEYLTGDSAAFHRHLGFTQAGYFRECGYKFGRWYSMVWMEKTIGKRLSPQPPVRACHSN